MKTAYELAMERLNQTAPVTKLTEAQKKQLAELDVQYAAKIAGREIALKDEIAKAAAAGEAGKDGGPGSGARPPVPSPGSRRSEANPTLFRFTMKDGGPFCFAGLWEKQTRPPETQESLIDDLVRRGHRAVIPYPGPSVADA